MGTKKYKTFLSAPFKKEHILYFNLREGSIIFDGEKYYSYNEIPVAPLPTNLDEFITDMKRIGIILEWKPEAIKGFEIKEILPQKEIPKYWGDLLTKMDKGHELNLEEESNE
jgi:hypothetical protein